MQHTRGPRVLPQCETIRSRCCVAFNFDAREGQCFLLASASTPRREKDPAKVSFVASVARPEDDGCGCEGIGGRRGADMQRAAGGAAA